MENRILATVRVITLIAFISLPVLGWAAPTILVLGDSLSAAYGIGIEQGWVALLQKKLQALRYTYNIINSSNGGDTTSNGLERLPAALKQYQPAIVILALGSNDGLRGLPIDAMKNNLMQMAELAKQSHAKVLLVGFLIPLNYGPIYRQQFEQAFKDVADRYNLPRVPFLLENVALHPELMQADGLHPNATAEPIILDTLWPYLNDIGLAK